MSSTLDQKATLDTLALEESMSVKRDRQSEMMHREQASQRRVPTVPLDSTGDGEREIERKLRESEERYRSLVLATAQIIWTTDANGSTIGDTSSWCAYTGQREEEIRGMQVLDPIHPDDRQRVLRIWLQAVANKGLYETEYRLRRHDGVYRFFAIRGVPVLNADGTVREWVGTCSDITERKQLEADLQESERRFRLMFEQASVGIAFASLDGQLLQCNQRYCEIVGHPYEELIGQSFADITHPEDLPLNREYLRRLLKGERHTTPMEKRYIRKDGSIVWASLTLSLMRDSAGTPLEYMAVIADISERKRAEAEAAAHASQLEATLAAMTDAVTVYDCDGHIMFASPTAQEVFLPTIQPNYYSHPLEEHLDHYELHDEYGQFLSPEQWPARRILNGEVLKDSNAMEVITHADDGHDIQFSVTGAPIHDTEGNITGGVLISRNVTERRRLERRTHEALEGLLSMAESLVQLPAGGDNMYEIGHRLAELTCDVLDCQRASIQIVEPQKELLRPLAVVGLSPEQKRAWWEEQQQAGSLKDSPTPELVSRLRGGEVLVLDMTQPPFRDMPNPYNITVLLAAPMRIHDRLVGILTLDYSGEAHVYTPGEIALASAVAKLAGLVIERQRLLQERAEAQGREFALRQANHRMEEFLGIASHELRTPMTTIKANIQLAQRRLSVALKQSEGVPEDVTEKMSAAQDMLARAERQVGVLNRLVSDLIDISRIQKGKLELHLRQKPCDLVGIVREAVSEQRKATPARTIWLEVATDTAVPVIVDPDRIAQVITNYLSNALKYSAADKPVEVRLEVEQEGEGEERRQVARVSVRDEGPGLSEYARQHIWQRFFQAEGVKVQSGSSVGLGLGLHISRTLIERHGGRVGVESVPGKGSTFWFVLPSSRSF